jgi:DNA-binding MarR family transcriptional regulator
MANQMQQDLAYRETIATFLALYRYLRSHARKLHREGLSGRKVSMLRYLVEAGPLTVGQLSDYLCISDSSTSGLLDGLGKNGYVTRARCQHDQRVVHVNVTEAGRQVVKEIPLGGISLLREALKTLPAEQLAVVRDALILLTDLLRIDDDH